MKRIAIVTSGGDAPGMNAAIRAVTRAGVELGMEIYGVQMGYAGLARGDLVRLGARDVGGILALGGTILGTMRLDEFKEPAVQMEAIENLTNRGIEGLVVIGGNGSQRGARALSSLGFPVVGVASTIDNDLYGSDVSIGTDTALNTVIESIDRIKTTAESHRRVFLVEVMGRKHGYLALVAGIAGGAEVVVTPEREVEPPEIAAQLRAAHDRGKKYALVVVTDGARNNAERVAKYFREHGEELGYELRVTIIGHVQRGGSPTVFDRVLASRLGAAAAELLAGGMGGQLVGWLGGEVAYTPLDEVATRKKELDPELWRLSAILAK